MGVRCDAVSVIYSLWLGTFLLLGRNKSSSIWRIYLLFLAVMLPVQYALVLGWPPGLCTGKNFKYKGYKIQYKGNSDWLIDETWLIYFNVQINQLCCRFSEFPLYCILLKYSVVPVIKAIGERKIQNNPTKYFAIFLSLLSSTRFGQGILICNGNILIRVII